MGKYEVRKVDPLRERTYTLWDIKEILVQWQGFDPDADGVPLWSLLDGDNNDILCNFLKTELKQAGKKKYAELIDNNKILYANICLLSPVEVDLPELTDEERLRYIYDSIIDYGWGILVFNKEHDKAHTKYGWKPIKEDYGARNFHYENRASLFKICKEYRERCAESYCLKKYPDLNNLIKKGDHFCSPSGELCSTVCKFDGKCKDHEGFKHCTKYFEKIIFDLESQTIQYPCQWSSKNVPIMVIEKCTSRGHSSRLIR